MLLLVVYAETIAPEVPADLLNGPLAEGNPFPVALGDDSRTSGELLARRDDGTLVVAIAGRQWELVPRAPEAMSSTRPDSRHRFQRFVVRAPREEIGKDRRKAHPGGGCGGAGPGSEGRRRAARDLAAQRGKCRPLARATSRRIVAARGRTNARTG